MLGGMTKLWWRHQGGFKVRTVTLLSPPGKYGARKWVGLTYTRKEESILLLIVIFSTFIHQLPCTNTEMPSQWSSAVVLGSLFTALRRMSRCCFSEKSQRCLTESSKTNWLTSSYNVLKMTPFFNQSRKGYTSMNSTAYGKYRLQIWRTLSSVLFLRARLSWGELLSKRKIV